MKQLTGLVFITFLSFQLSAQDINIINNNVIFTTFPELEFDYDIRSIGFGTINAVNPHHNTAALSFSNPALFASSKKKWANAFNYHFLSGERYSFSAQIARKVNRKNSLGLLLKNYTNNTIYPLTFLDGTTVETYETKLSTLGLYWGHRFNKNWSIGLGGSYLHAPNPFENLNPTMTTENINTYFFDLGLHYKTRFKLSENHKLTLQSGLTINNLGPKASYWKTNAVQNSMPTNLALGLALTHSVKIGDGNLYTTLGYQPQKLLVPTPSDIDDDGNGLPDFWELSIWEGIVTSFSDAPLGTKEELDEITHKLALELTYKIKKWEIGLRAGGFNEAIYKGNRRYRSFGASLGYNGYLINYSYQNVFGTHSLGCSMNI